MEKKMEERREERDKEREEERNEEIREEKKKQVRMGHRWEVDIPLDYTFSDSNKVWEAKLLDLSLRGARVSSASVPLIGEEIKLAINIPGEFSELDALGKVVWAKRTGTVPSCGIAFTKIRDTDKERILSYLDSNFGEQLRKKIWWKDSE